MVLSLCLKYSKLAIEHFSIKKAFCFFLVSLPLLVFCQTGLPIEFSYDAAGNRVTRRVIEMRMAQSDIGTDDSIHYDVPLQSTEIHVYPNPTDGVVIMESPSFLDSAPGICALVYDSRGCFLFGSQAKTGSVRIDLSDYPSGYYIVDLSIKGEHSMWKIIKK